MTDSPDAISVLDRKKKIAKKKNNTKEKRGKNKSQNGFVIPFTRAVCRAKASAALYVMKLNRKRGAETETELRV